MIQELSTLLLDPRLRVRHIRRAIHPQVLIIRENEEKVGLARGDRRLIIQQYLLLHSEGVASDEQGQQSRQEHHGGSNNPIPE